MNIKHLGICGFMVSCLVLSCTEKKKEMPMPDKVIEMDRVDGYMNEIIDTVMYLPLEKTEQSVLSRVNKLLSYDSLYFLADFNYSKIAVYTHTGKLKYVLNKRGHGRGEYLETRNFTVHGDKLYTIDNFQSKINIYNKETGEYIESMATDIVASDIAAFGENEFLLTSIPNGQPQAKEQPENLVFLMDEDFQVKDAYFPYEKDYCEPLSRYSYFSTTDSSVIFSSFLYDGCAEMMKSNGHGIHTVQMNLKYPIPEGQRTKKESYDSSTAYAFVSQTPIACKHYWYVDVTKDRKLESFVYDTHEDKLYRNDESSMNKMAFIVGSDDRHFISYVPDKAYYDELVKYGLHRADSLTETSLAQGGSALVLYTVR